MGCFAFTSEVFAGTRDLNQVSWIWAGFVPGILCSFLRRERIDYATVTARDQNEPAFAEALLNEALTLFINGEPEAAKLILRDLVNASIGFEALALEIGRSAKSVHRMLSHSGNPTIGNISAIFVVIKRTLKVEVRMEMVIA